MTAEIAIMNKMGVALATDSAVTIGDRAKFYNTANKLFMLSKYQPVGIMIYNNSDFMGTPWEVIIKEYRAKLDTDEKDHLVDYGNDFFDFLISPCFNYTNYNEQYYKNVVTSLLFEIKEYIDSMLREGFLQKKQLLSDQEITSIIDTAVTFFENVFSGQSLLPNLPIDYVNNLATQFDSNLTQHISETIPLFLSHNAHNLSRLKILCNNLFVLNNFTKIFTGVVIAGYGKLDHFPQLISYKVSGYLNGFLKYVRLEPVSISNELNKDFFINPFAQTDVVQTFLHGINYNFINVFRKNFNDELVNKLEDKIFTAEQKNIIRQLINTQADSIIKVIDDYSNNEYYWPVLRAIKVLPIDELALMAESLVNLTSFRRQVAVDEKSLTVGGPIDVAVISKGDGFVWIKRKHYFKSELNHHFFKNYFNNQND